MKHRSNKTAATYRKWTPIRNQYLVEFPRCAVCGEGGVSVHEILSGTGYRMLAFVEPACWLAACWDCNSNRLTDRREWPVERQLGLKLHVDPDRFDMTAVDGVYAPRRIDWAEVLRHYVTFKQLGSRNQAA